MYITMATTFSHAYSTQRRPHTGIIAIPMHIKSVKGQLKVRLGEGLKSSASPRTLNSPHPN